MTAAQQRAARQLEQAQEQYLLAYGWQRDGQRWRHPRVSEGKLLCKTHDAMAWTRANPQIGW